jgi:hypothetical protein
MDGTVLFQAHGTFGAVTFASKAGVTLSSNSHAITNLDTTLSLRTDTDSNANDFMANTAWVLCRTLCEN